MIYRDFSTLDTTSFAKELRQTVTDLKTAYREELSQYHLKVATGTQKPSDGATTSGSLGDDVGDDSVARGAMPYCSLPLIVLSVSNVPSSLAYKSRETLTYCTTLSAV